MNDNDRTASKDTVPSNTSYEALHQEFVAFRAETQRELANLRARRAPWTAGDVYLVVYGLAIVLMVIGFVIIPAVTG